MDNFSIDFYSQSEAAVTITWPKVLEECDEILMDSMLFSCFLIRQLRNLGDHPSNFALIREIIKWTPNVASNLETQLGWTVYPEVTHEKHIIYHAGISIGMDPARAQQLYAQEILLVPYHGKGTKSFTGSLSLGRSHPIFILNVSGFGFLGRNIPMYATDSIFHFLIFICKKYPLVQDLPSKLIQIAQGCVKAYLNNEVDFQNQELIAQEYVNRFLHKK